MNTASQRSPYVTLREIEARSRQYAFGLPQKEEVRRTWSGVGFRLGEAYLIAEMDSVSEIMRLPSYTRIPSPLPWVCGLANVRGILLPIMDLGTFINQQPIKQTRRSRVMLVANGDNYTGLLVDEVFGMRHFFKEDYAETMAEGVPESLQSYISGSYTQQDNTWNVFNMASLTQQEAFINIAAHGAQK